MVPTSDSPGPPMGSVPTRYGDTTFRSRLEADWAATLDSNNIVWEYEPETITVPDFWLPELGTWIEVKGPGIPRAKKTKEPADTRACRCENTCTCRGPATSSSSSADHPWPPTGPRPTTRPAAATQTGRPPSGPPHTS
ncbi:hypothetical protein [Streptomyces sp. NPDC048845]|uniref:hypothetical protein n=1 Tax=Streptomyces sp. NPDC048845 TaxID=3155390 RepID=UPI003431C24B